MAEFCDLLLTEQLKINSAYNDFTIKLFSFKPDVVNVFEIKYILRQMESSDGGWVFRPNVIA